MNKRILIVFFIFLIVLILGVMNPVNAVVHWPDCSQIGGNEIPADVRRVDCENREIARSILEEKETVSTKLYHFGKPPHIQENVAARNIPQTVWENVIMQNRGRFSLKSFRWGLYGTSTIDVNYFHGEGYDALMEIELHPECVNAKNVATLHELYKDKKFREWYSSKDDLPFRSFKSVQLICFNSLGEPKENWINTVGRGDEDLSDCEKVITRYLEEAKIKVVHDYAATKAFYIRDRSCIKTIRGTPKELLHIFADKTYLWLNSCHESGNSLQMDDKKTGKIFSLVIGALKNLNEPIERDVYNKLKRNVSYLQFGDQEHTENIIQDWHALFEAHDRCQALCRMDEFRNHVRGHFRFQFLTDFESLCGPPFDSNCGHHLSK